MIVPGLLFILSLALGFCAILLFGPVVSDLILLAALCAIASLLLLLRAFTWPRKQLPFRWPERQRPTRRQRNADPNWIVVDGSNVLYWKSELPVLDSVTALLSVLKARGFFPMVWFDANVGYLISDRYLNEGRIAGLLGVAASQVSIAPKGTPADPLLLADARHKKCKVVTNDRYRDWVEAHPEVLESGFLIRGDFRDGLLRLDARIAAETERLTA